MDAEEILKLLDSYWFEHQILSSKNKPSISSSPTSIKSVHDQEHPKLEKPKLSEIAMFQIRSQSDRCLRCNTGFSPDAASPRSVIPTPRLEKILFGNEISDFSESAEEQGKIETTIKKKVSNRRKRSRRRRKGIGRSLSELEYEELKGFMDLGFAFTEEDKTSSLVAILPGLQRWGKKASDEPILTKCRVSRPYLSEAWDVLNQRKVNKPLVSWRFPPTCNENNMKDHLKAWAHKVASSVR